jgi:thiamine pyrophosphate-dependent acetolactate synthase large subunit-like protein
VALTGAELLVRGLESAGVEVCFGLPGVHNLAAWKALASSDIRLVGVRHEQAAAYAADGYARATGRLGVALTTTGPGAANTLGAVGEAWASAEYVLVRGPEVSDDTYGLTPAQQRRARDLAVVAAMPVTNASDEVIAVVGGSSVDPRSGLATGDGFDALLLMAQEVARVLVDLLQWFPD